MRSSRKGSPKRPRMTPQPRPTKPPEVQAARRNPRRKPPPKPIRQSASPPASFARDDIDLNDISLLREEIIRNLREDGGEVSIEIVVRAHKSDGFSESATRAVRENGIQLGLDIDI